MTDPRMTKDFSVFDCDAHVNDPLEIWEEYRPEGHRGSGSPDLLAHGPRGHGERGYAGDGWRQRRVRGRMYNPICIAGPQMNKKIMRKLISMMPLTDEQREYVGTPVRYDAHSPHHATWT